MLEVLHVGVLILVGVGVAEFALWSWHKGRVWWVAVISAVLAYVSFLSGFLLEDKDALLYKLTDFLWSYLLSQPSVATLVFLLLFVGLFAFGLFLFRNRPPLQNHIIATVYEGSPVLGRFKVGASVTLSRLAKDPKRRTFQRTDKVDEEGLVAFRVPGRGHYWLRVTVVRQGKPRIGGWPPFSVEKLPHLENVNISEISPSGWVDAVTAPALASLESQPAGVPMAEPEPHVQRVIGDPMAQSENAPWGIPEAAVVISRSGYVLGYNPEKRIPRWVSYLLVGEKNQNVKRPLRFSSDPDIPQDAQADTADYAGTGYDLGCLVPFADMTFRGQQAINQAAVFSTMAPQTPGVNRGAWLNLEKYARSLAQDGQTVTVTAGPAFGKSPAADRTNYLVIGQNRVAVPTHFFRVLARRKADGRLETLPFIVPNIPNPERDISRLLTTLKEVESISGLVLFPRLDAEIKRSLCEAKPGSLW